MGNMKLGILQIFFGVAVAWLGGCQTQPPVALPPQVSADAQIFAGTPISGPLTDVPQVSPDRIRQVRVRWITMQQMADAPLVPINARSRLIIAPASGTVLPANADLTRPVGYAAGEQATEFVDRLEAGELGEWEQIAADSRLVVPGATIQFEILPLEDATDFQPRLALLVSPGSPIPPAPDANPPAETVLAVRVSERSTVGPRYTTGRSISETAVVDPQYLGDAATFVVAMPVAGVPAPWTALAAVATIDSAPADADEVDRLQAALVESAQRAGTAPAPLGDAPTLRAALQALKQADSHRPALLLLARLCDARIAADMALVASTDQLADLAAATLQSADPDAPPTIPELQWLLDRTALQAMCRAAEGEALSPELQSVLALHTGDVARRPDVILAMLPQVGDSPSLRQRLIAENYIALEDTSPAARVRAYDWLAAHDRAPAGFDPLADAKSRRAAIDQAMTQLGDQP